MAPKADVDGKIVVMTALEATRVAKPRYNGWQCRGGVHGDTKYVREHSKRDFRKYLRDAYGC